MKIKNIILPIIFCIFLLFFTVLLIFSHKSSYSQNEKRVLSDFPELNLSSITSGSFTKELDIYISDHFPLRDGFVGINAYAQLLTGQNGKSGIYKCGERLITAPAEFDEAKVTKNLSAINSFAKKTGLKSTVAIVPEAGYVYENELPKNHEEYNDDRIIDLSKQLCTSSTVVDLRKTFKNEVKDTKLYYNTDHHLTSEGSLLFYREFCIATDTSIKQFNISRVLTDFYGTTYSKSGLWLTEPDSISIYTTDKKSNFTVTIDDGKGVEEYNSLFFYGHNENPDKYPVFLNGNHSLVTITNNNCHNGKKLLLIKDSYAHCLATLLAEDYESIVMIDLRYYRKPLTKIISQYGLNEALFVYGAENISTSTDIPWLTIL